MRDANVGFRSIFDQNVHNFVVGEPSKTLYRVRTRRHLKRLVDKREKGNDAGEQVNFKEKFEENVKEKGKARSFGISSF